MVDGWFGMASSNVCQYCITFRTRSTRRYLEVRSLSTRAGKKSSYEYHAEEEYFLHAPFFTGKSLLNNFHLFVSVALFSSLNNDDLLTNLKEERLRLILFLSVFKRSCN